MKKYEGWVKDEQFYLAPANEVYRFSTNVNRSLNVVSVGIPGIFQAVEVHWSGSGRYHGQPCPETEELAIKEAVIQGHIKLTLLREEAQAILDKQQEKIERTDKQIRAVEDMLTKLDIEV